MVHSDNYADHDYGTNNEYEISYFYFVFLTLLLSSLLFQNIVHTKWKIEWFPEAAGISERLIIFILNSNYQKVKLDNITLKDLYLYLLMLNYLYSPIGYWNDLWTHLSFTLRCCYTSSS